MGLEVEVRLLEDQRFEINAFKTGTKAYIDNKREDYSPQTPNPSELFLASIGGCVLYYATKYLTRRGVGFKKLSVKVRGEWSKEPLMLKNIEVQIFTDARLGDRKGHFLRVVHNCPVHNTIVNTQKIDIQLSEG